MVDECHYCYQCQKFVGPVEEEEWDESGTEGMCPEESVYTDAFDEACDKLVPFVFN